ncbi:uncharacterized protein LOC110728649 [Chenopodium quinoa]|uniref:uncharacterized protein LOC110728649 n=1 Tax=Chenopodium quinoa TaxID=63459 RepID=UPI000B79464B|nr:uncharacterized protein LOC110728649 [Chenopodium quinoa]
MPIDDVTLVKKSDVIEEVQDDVPTSEDGKIKCVMPLSVCKRLNMGALDHTNNFANGGSLYKYPLGVLEDVPVQVGKFYILVDFVVLDMEDSQISIILDRPFLCIPGVVIDVKSACLTLSIGDDIVNFKLTNAMKSRKNTCRINVIDEITRDHMLLDDPLEAVLTLEVSK